MGLPVVVAVLATGSHAGVAGQLRHLEQAAAGGRAAAGGGAAGWGAAAWKEVCQATPAEPTGCADLSSINRPGLDLPVLEAMRRLALGSARALGGRGLASWQSYPARRTVSN